MEVDVITTLRNGVVIDTQVVKCSGTAEATFDSVAQKVLGWTEEEYENEVERMSYEERYSHLTSKYLLPLGIDIIWVSRIKVNKFS